MEPASVLGDRPAPRNRKRQEQRVQPRVVESLAHVLAGCQDDARFLAWDGRQAVCDGLSLLLAQPGAQDHEVAHLLGEPALEAIHVVVPLREHER